jgi:ribosomal protein S18 acetylase RimI-like enzyme
MNPIWRPMQTADIGDVIAIAAIVHPGYPETDDVLAERLALYPAGCFILDRDGAALGYLLSHPWRYADPPRLNMRLERLPEQPDTYYLHDIALLPEAQGLGAAAAMAEQLADLARASGFANISLCAVNGSAPFWQRRGFMPVVQPALAVRLESYGADVRFMVRVL